VFRQSANAHVAVDANAHWCLPTNPQKNDQAMAWSFDVMVSDACAEAWSPMAKV
jgi:hypothetical protein